MRNSALSKSRGFTLIELLIVIALLGALAIGLLATIDPFEQLKKGRDTAIRNTTAEIFNANLRYYATRGEFQWGTVATAGSVHLMTGMLTALINAGELKQRFTDLAGTNSLSKIFVNSTARDSLTVCFQPESKSFQNDPVTIFNISGGSGLSCRSTGGTAPCHICLQ